MIKIQQAFEEAINSISPTIATEYQNVSFTPTNGVPYQQLFILPASNDDLFIDTSNFEASGIFQITLRYPSGKGMKAVSERAELYVSSFYTGRKLVKDDVKVRVLDTPTIRNLGIDGDRVVVVVSISYSSYI